MKNKIIDYCLKKKGAIKDYPFGADTVVIKIGGKMFALIFEGKADNVRLNLKCDPIIAENLREQHESVQPGYHMNKKHWNTIILDGSLSEQDIYVMIDHSYDMVVKTLSKSLMETIS
ncbi:MmcQ/YjbR family DNA-binding protein [Paenibacillus sp. 11B]|uniref:MmcQ/YjbR family DNA-binding protein n=1 Tax=Paenibacillus TaxID=44249 RepID=UPI000BA03606|nr:MULTISPECIES: MmcQ/YjbR family DNA-binding protein [Paenibacillus]MDN8589119.1 MmcQ/YjbR family DNA-binding protein [Paenibacillus sp. 11B]OZQ73300.1 MmcQ-like protein [Paenibacillus taichungensis]HBU82108.1 MmcQ/YjbR family DNA-binding protein [Paenibacillus sp.]